MERRHEIGRGEKVLPGVWRLRLPVPWPGVPHCNAWALAAGDGVVLFDAGLYGAGSMGHVDLAMSQVNLKVEQVKLLVCTHAHTDHYGNAAPIVERAGCELWMHPNHDHMLRSHTDPEAAWERRIEVARQSGVPEKPLREWAESRRAEPSGIAEIVHPDKELVPGVHVHTDLGAWEVYETPGHAPSHVCLYQPESRVLISGDHLLGRVSLFYDYGYSPDPAGELLHSLDVVETLDARLCLAGHGRTFTDVQAHIQANRDLVHERVDLTAKALADGPKTALEAVPFIFGEGLHPAVAAWRIQETLVYLNHLDGQGRAERDGGELELWSEA